MEQQFVGLFVCRSTVVARDLDRDIPSGSARLAVQMFCYSVRKQVAAMIAALEGVDLIVFTGGIGENDAKSRATICTGLSWIGVSLDDARNRSAKNPISGPESRCQVQVLVSQEGEEIARHTWTLLPPTHFRPGSEMAVE